MNTTTKNNRKDILRDTKWEQKLVKAHVKLKTLSLWWKDHIRGRILELLATGDIAQFPIQGKDLKKRIQEGISEGNRWVNVTDIFTVLRIEQSVASQHLWELEDVVGILTSQRDGQFIYYRIDEKKFTQISESLSICFPKKKNPEDKDDTWDPLEWEKNEISDGNKE